MIPKFLKEIFDIRKGERTKALLMSSFFFFVIATFWAIKPIKRGMLIGYYKEHTFNFFGWHLGGAQTEQLAKVANMFAAYGLAILFAFLSQRLSRRKLIITFCSIFGFAFLLFASLVGVPGPGTVWSFYVFGDMFNTAMVTLFWVFMNDIVSPDEAKRIYGLVGLGGVLGGFVGATIVRSSVTTVGRGMLLSFCIIPMIFIAIVGLIVNRRANAKYSSEADIPAVPRGSSVRDGIR